MMQEHSEPPPPSSPAERMLRTNWMASRWRSPAGAPLLSVEFVAEASQRVVIVDVRTRDELNGALGHIPGVFWVAAESIAEVAKRLPKTTFVILVSRGGERAALLAQYLELLGMPYVAAMDGGMREWRLRGFSVRRDNDIFDRTVETLAPRRTGLEPEAPKGHLDREQVTRHMGDPGTVRWIKLAAMVVNGKHACVDGRDEHGVIGTPGGDAGEFLLALGAYERATQRCLTEHDVRRLLSAYVDSVGRFYMHTDTHALNKMILQMRADPEIRDLLPPLPGRPEDWRKWITAPPMKARAQLHELFAQPDHIGCGHLRRMLQFPDLYGVRAEITRTFLSALWELYWAGSTEISISVLGGQHDEGAVLVIEIDEQELSAFSRVPLVAPASVHGQLFLHTPQVARYLRKNVLHFLDRNVDETPLDPAQRQSVRVVLEQLAESQLNLTLGALAAGLPLFQVRFHGESRFEVTELGHVATP